MWNLSFLQVIFKILLKPCQILQCNLPPLFDVLLLQYLSSKTLQGTIENPLGNDEWRAA